MLKQKRLQILLIALLLIFCLTFAVYSADLYGTYDNRLKITIDHTDIDSDLAWFPVTVFLTSSQGEEVFAEFDADEDFDRIAFTMSDGVTQLYADCKLFDDSESKAIYHVSKTGWVLDSDTDTEFYLYYDNTAEHNTTYISMSGGTAAQSVYDSNHITVQNMVDATTSTVLDSTSNNIDGTKVDENTPVQASTDLLGIGQTFDGDYVVLDDENAIKNLVASFTLTVVTKLNLVDRDQTFFANGKGGTNGWGLWFSDTSDYVYFTKYGVADCASNDALSVDTWYVLTLTVAANNNPVLYIDGTSVHDFSNTSAISANTQTDSISIGALKASSAEYLRGQIALFRLSNTIRSAAWIKAENASVRDSLLTYGAEEGGEEEAVTNTLFIFQNF
jgi:hypothetical protein